jgi:hypothetical protein
MSLCWFIPAFVKSSVSSSIGTRGELGIKTCPFDLKKSIKPFLISLELSTLFLSVQWNPFI